MLAVEAAFARICCFAGFDGGVAVYSDAFLRDRPHKANGKPNRNRKKKIKKSMRAL